jgi:hypothetical protein
MNKLILPEGDPGKGWIPYKMQCSFGNRGELDCYVVAFFFTDEQVSFANTLWHGMCTHEWN